MPPAGAVHVVAGALTGEGGRILIAQRPPGKPLAGGWEFPGGKLEPGETRRAGLARELAEELGIVIREPRPLIRVRHTYPHGDVLIDVFVVTRYDGVPRGLDGQALRWLTQEELERADLLPADRPIVRALRLPERLSEVANACYDIDTTPRERTAPPAADADEARLRGRYCSGVDDAVIAAAGRADFVVLTDGLAPAPLERLCDAVEIPVYARDLTLEAAWAAGATGVHTIAP